ncbi:efflux RND transporter periplasmic adaptor subunit [Rhodohalobacter sulfatireducens]|uniref:Efflux RND transporter periplasmic adaptor subunit n=1 Tax=Rhodohalobacter sulfatireducens TaxID=2911366 RepID=A0ABS9KDW0_9BACT|nr:efflux RND transporter periplasmic adaptor subunit [Rhodohalobacter sulfatireducens]MCG2589046.1 efflux RND transporter periplasmic adaptor subunit [Rhodohalobacter sulfatireducens]MDR9366733.1 efflux RND transporter periplasmic adaptor subunit [Balneolaceae bacterium]MDR9409342.1 efflux RND transporter periplasmic adaptor subunit [Balneolaceae bacterium]
MSTKKTILISFGILIAGAAIILLIFNTEPEAQRSGATKQTAMLVNTVQVERSNFTPTISAMGTVVPSQDVMLSPRVGGQIIQLSENFTPGGYVEEGEMLLQIDPADYRNALQQRISELQQAQTNLEIEMGRQNVARQDYELLDDSLTNENRSLVLREPQLNAARSNVQSAEAAVEQAELNLERTTIRAPFDAYILSRNVNLGSQVSPGDELARLVGRDTYWIETTVPLRHLRWIDVPQNGNGGSPVTIRNRSVWDEDEYREGSLFRLVGTLTDETRLARILVEVPDPHGYEQENSDRPRLMIGSYVVADIQAQEIQNVVRLSRDYVRQNDTIWVNENDTLRIRDAEILFRDANYAYITEGIEDGEHVVTTNLSTVVDGSPLRLEGSAATAMADSVTTE